jgi:hypothetical protein
MDFDSLCLEAPQGWTHRHLLTFRIDRGTPRDRDPSIVVARLPRVDTLEASVLHHVINLAKRLPDFVLLERTACRVDGRQAIRARFKAVREGLVREEVSVYVEAPEGDLVVLGCSWVEGDTRAQHVTQRFEQMLAGARFTSSGEPERRSAVVAAPEGSLDLPDIPMPAPLRPSRRVVP